MYAEGTKEGHFHDTVQPQFVDKTKMSAQRMSVIQEKGANWHPRGYKSTDTRLNVGNPLYLGEYQGHSGNTGWSDESNLPFDPAQRFGSNSYNRFMGGATGYGHNGYVNNLPNSTTGALQNTAQATQSTTNDAIYPSVVENVSPTQPSTAQTVNSPPESSVNVDIEDVAHHFVYRYYSLLHSNPSGMFNLYSRKAHICKNDLHGNRIAVNGHADIKNYYSQFLPKHTTAHIRHIEVQNIGNQGSLLILIVGDVNTRMNNKILTKRVSHAVVLVGDQAKTRFHIVNDVTIQEQIVSEKTEVETQPIVHKEPEAVVPPKNQVMPQAPPSTQEVINDSHAQKMRERGRCVIMGLPKDVTVDELRKAINNRFATSNKKDARVLRVDIKIPNHGGEDVPLIAFVLVDSWYAADVLVSGGIVVRDKRFSVDIHKRGHNSRELPAAGQGLRPHNKHNAW
ncbi:Nuclear transport factor 2 (NTF2) domain family protein [Babesia bovis T2Bo]|uniref:NTF2 domain-containing protein n=1 Tax=Babesia bovis TaxID=5865 RepID=A7ARE4_BABBO|nr:Nuclear transport factor 2 (NTF2) domain family protein [Babesia bovis T2Bo]EDO07113.1 Nuclear transport factor 2 (NTF2) domain family protein [Babesia bovis T2Bo]BAN64421.1 hypothetical protein [Babesia bovis]|eukprot:XP_001610681.1 hypothetical protein [Babesia bovis T2Bo]